MKLLALESSAVAASVALCEDEELIAQSFQHSGLTHSRTLLPMARDLLNNCGVSLHDVDLIAVAAGPGSFTGLRIGVATAKGLAWAEDKPCCGVSTLEAMAWNVAHVDGVVCCAMDARRKQVYNALFEARDGRLLRLTEDRAIGAEAVFEEENGKKVNLLVGDGAKLCYNVASEAGLHPRLAPPHLLYQSAWGVARAALEQARRGETTSAEALVPVYLRLSQAERERLERNQNC
jgi:tRNA threonylcarbamoyladenosine biosynthesis protein TsaB